MRLPQLVVVVVVLVVGGRGSSALYDGRGFGMRWLGVRLQPCLGAVHRALKMRHLLGWTVVMYVKDICPDRTRQGATVPSG